MKLIDDIDHLRRARDAERFDDSDGAELTGYIVAERSNADAVALVTLLQDASDRLTHLAACSAHAARLFAQAVAES